MKNRICKKPVSRTTIDPSVFYVLSAHRLDKAVYKLYSLSEKFKRSFPVGKSDLPGQFGEVFLKNIPQHASTRVSELDLGRLPSRLISIPSNLNMKCKTYGQAREIAIPSGMMLRIP